MALPVLCVTGKKVDTVAMKQSSIMSTAGVHSDIVDQVGFSEYLAIYSGVCFSLAASLFLGMTLIGAALPLAAVAAVFFAAR